VCSKTIANQDAWSLVSLFFGFGIKYTLEPLEANYRIGISRIRARILLSRGKEYNPVVSIGIRWLDYHRVQIPIITTNAFDRSHGYTLDSRISIVSLVIFTYEDFDGAWYKQHYSSLVYIIHILDEDSRVL
jgi:hypothetical protein